ncbi:MAG TPA: DUF2079 domain-containing protein [Candidatus Eisenbacteria bacterium]|nr:DUF2079 domain-containing protein [Candidatus Eisenbacteria bacterium]
MALRAVRVLALGIAAAALLVLVAITLGIPTALGVPLTRFREPTWALWAALALFVTAHERPRESWRRAAGRAVSVLESRPFFGRMAAAALALHLLVSVRVHLSFHTFSHDFSMFDESLWWSHHGRFLYAPVLGRSYLTEHFSPILALLVPLHALFSSPWMLVVANAALLGAAVFPLRTLLDALGLPPAARNVTCLVYLTSPITASALDYGFHVESFLPLLVFALYAAHLRGPAWAYAILLVASLAIKEDVGLYLAGFGAFLFVAEKRRARGALTAAAGLAWVLLVVLVVGPRLAGATGEYRFLSRWASWGSGIGGILGGMASHPGAVLLALIAPAYLLFFWRLIFTPFFSRWGWLLFVIPWGLGATSSSRPQATLGLYYGLPLLAFAGLAAARGVAAVQETRSSSEPGSALGRRLAALAPALAAIAVALNVAHFTVQPIPQERDAVLTEIRRIPPGATVQAMPTLYPDLRYEQPKTVLMPGDSLMAQYILLRTDTTAWPFSTEQVNTLTDRAVASGAYRARFDRGGFRVLMRRS